MLICTVFTDKMKQFSKLIISPEITDGTEKIEIQLTKKQAEEIIILEQLSNERE